MDWQITPDRPVYLQLIEQLELAIAAGEYPAAARLPAVRELAAQAAVNPNTMQRALQELEARGLLVTQRTAGRSVTGDGSKIAGLRRRLAEAEAARFLQRMGRLGCTPAEALGFLRGTVGAATAAEEPAQPKKEAETMRGEEPPAAEEAAQNKPAQHAPEEG